ncbi:hypothetical protein DID75_02850 [Candidatus Marinamargulisbacteria bacterium SCGC AG-410-N11]|nr:hypothetical protein DID75_02850 [Candidatus Marinamargulisbacteria bacterium SCGC AG-410-N11]
MNSKLKTFSYIAIILLFISIAIPIYQDSQIKDFTNEDDEYEARKQLEIKNSTITGFKDGKLSWRIKANYIWTTSSKYLFRAEKIISGDLFDNDGVNVITDLYAEQIRVNSNSKTLSAYENIMATFLRRLKNNLETNKIYGKEPDTKSVKITADELRYFSLSKKTYLYDNITIKQKNTLIYPKKEVQVDNDKNIAYVQHGFNLNSKEYVVSGNKMVIYIDDDYSEMSGNIFAKRKAKPTTNMTLDKRERDMRSKPTYLTCEYMKYTNKDDNDEVNIFGNIHIYQGNRVIKGDKGLFNKQKNYYQIEGNVVFQAPDLIWLLNKNKNFQNQDIAKSIKMNVKITADKMSFDSDKKRIEMTGNVKFTQSDKTITCKKLIYKDDKEELTLMGAINIIKDKNEKLKCHYLVLNLQDESFFADKGIKTEFTVKKNKEN